jgi:DNA-binding CsgD family transcriptional regulator
LRRGIIGRGRAVSLILVLVRDPLNAARAACKLLRDVFGLTAAEADLARSLQNGVSVSEHARSRSVSINTAYTHLRRIKEKTGCSRIAELIHRLNDLAIPAP